MCFKPFTITNKQNDKVDVPCGKCPRCVSRKISEWSFRLLQQDKVSTNSSFITLTYGTDHLPFTKSGRMDLHKRDLQLFFKRLRKAHERRLLLSRDGRLSRNKPIKYFAVGEYGSNYERPHYHVILFNCRDELIQDAWQNGNVYYGKVSGASVGYCLKYIMKRGRVGKKKGDDRTPEFALMSKGLGANYLTEAMKLWHTADVGGRMYCNLTDGKKIAMPRYYKDKIYDEYQRIIAGFAQREQQLQREAKEIEKAERKEKGSYYRIRDTRIVAAYQRMEKSITEISKSF